MEVSFTVSVMTLEIRKKLNIILKLPLLEVSIVEFPFSVKDVLEFLQIRCYDLSHGAYPLIK